MLPVNHTNAKYTNRNLLDVITILLCIVFTLHFSISIVIVHQLYVYGFIILFGFAISLIILVFVIGLIFVEYLFLCSTDEDIVNPFAPFILILYFVTAGKCDFDVRFCKQINRDFVCCKITNYIIVVLLLPIFVIFAPFYSIAHVLVRDAYDNESFRFWINYQILSITSGTIMSFIIICLRIQSFPMIINILCMIAVATGITYWIIIIFFAFDTHRHKSTKYWYGIPFIIIIETLLIINMIFIVYYKGLWSADFVKLEYILLLICFINVFIPNLPFFKSVLFIKYIDMLQDNESFKFVIYAIYNANNANNDCQLYNRFNNSQEMMDKMFCILLSILKQENKSIVQSMQNNTEQDTLLNKQQSQTKLISMQQIIMEQYKYSKLSDKNRKYLIENNIYSLNPMKYHKCKQIMKIFYGLSSLIALISPFLWIIKISIDDISIHWKSAQFFFVWFITFYYMLLIITFMICIKKNKLKISWECIYYALLLKRINSKQNSNHIFSATDYHQRLPAISIVFDHFQTDIGMIIILYLF